MFPHSRCSGRVQVHLTGGNRSPLAEVTAAQITCRWSSVRRSEVLPHRFTALTTVFVYLLVYILR